MSREIPEATIADLEAAAAPGALLAFLTLSHRNLVEPIRVVSDVMDYMVDGALYLGAPFEFALLQDSDAAPTTQIRVQNVDRRIGEAVRLASGRIKVRCEIRYSADFDLSLAPREPFGEADTIYAFRDFELSDITVTPLDVSGTVMLHDYSTIPWPGVRATQSRCPGLFR